MIKRDVKRILPAEYDVSMAPWYDAIKKDFDRYSYRILLISYLVTINIPVFFLVNELYHGRTSLILNYAIPAVIMAAMILYLVICKNIKVMRIAATLTALTGFFCAVLLPGSHNTYLIILLNFIPIVFALYGRTDGVKWFAVFIISFVILAPAGSMFRDPGITSGWASEYNSVVFISLLIMFAIIYTSQRQYEKVIRRLVRSIAYDPVTGLPNKDSFLRCIGGLKDSVVAIIHITNFKSLATLFGYEFSDRILVMITDTLHSLAPGSGFRIYKLNWHEFGIQFPFNEGQSHEEAEKRLNSILNNLRSRKIRLGNMDVNLAISIGGVIVTGGEYDSALSHADSALGYGLSRHKNVTIYSEGMDIKRETFDRVKKYSILHDNIINNTLKVYLQPVVNSWTGRVCWYESLLRIQVDEGVYESVPEYIEIAKDTDLYPSLTRFMLEQAGRFIRELSVPVSVNISPDDIMNGMVLKQISEITGDSCYEAGSLILEILESDEISNIDDCVKFIRSVQSMGVMVAIDDFGAGYSNISNLLRLRLDIVKIDGELIRRVEHDKEAYLFIKGIYEFCRNTGYRVVAEFIENDSILQKIREIGIEYCQGYFFGKPEPREEIQSPASGDA